MQSVKGKKTNIPEELSETDKIWLSRFLWMDKIWFKWIFANKITHVETRIIYWETSGRGKNYKSEPEKAEIYSIPSVVKKGTSEEYESIYCFLVFYNDRIYKETSIERVAELLGLFKKQHEHYKYKCKKENEDYRKKTQRKKLRAAKKAA